MRARAFLKDCRRVKTTMRPTPVDVCQCVATWLIEYRQSRGVFFAPRVGAFLSEDNREACDCARLSARRNANTPMPRFAEKDRKENRGMIKRLTAAGLGIVALASVAHGQEKVAQAAPASPSAEGIRQADAKSERE